MTNRAELRRLAEAAPENIDDDWMGLKRTEMRAALTPSVVIALLDELDAKDNTLLALTTRHFAESWSRRSTDAKLDEYLSAGIAQLQEERDAALADLEACRKDAERWRFVIDRGVLNESAIDEFMQLNAEAMSQEANHA
ncbi:hypothetical protein [Bowmanella yangjiangensis]|uniref:Ead/Ea22-like family protein n=1 Tax=Bowmanella yangjiangensis TaxID=2811230 RepID=A0ABS3D1U4_9ALTE|nr:hypothetical protein [Bowmanella yangjiangensis]MBN7822565.1 hypothetical protein [Bowmanella yangjiangensis]